MNTIIHIVFIQYIFYNTYILYNTIRIIQYILYNSTIKMKPTEVNLSTYADIGVNNDKDPKFEVGDSSIHYEGIRTFCLLEHVLICEN